MVLLRAETFLAGVLGQGHPSPRNAIGATGVQVYTAGGMSWSKKRVIIRNAPYTINSPHLGQAETRVHFGLLAKEAEGCKGLVDGLPCVAAHIRDRMPGYKAEDRMAKEEYPSRKRGVHTLEQLQAMIEARKKAGVTPSYARYRGGIPPTLGI